nr:PmV-like protein [Menippe mercenaria nudivirus]
MATCVFDTYYQIMMDRINKALPQQEYVALEDGDWNESYVKFFLSIYTQICDITGCQYIRSNTKGFEPVTLHVNPKQDCSEDPIVIHCVSIPVLQWAFKNKNSLQIHEIEDCRLRMPSVFPLADNVVDEDYGTMQRKLNNFVSEKLTTLYVYADHAAYHYKRFIASGDADYEHKYIRTRSNTNTLREVKHVHDFITSEPNDNLTDFLKTHKSLNIESLQHDRSFTNISFHR